MVALFELGIDLDVWPWIWLGTAVLFAIVELVLVGGSFIILPWSASAFIASILAFYDAPMEAQWAVFVFGGAGFFVLLYRWAQRFMDESTMDPGVGADRLVGLTGIVTSAILTDDIGRAGRVSVDGESWGALNSGSVSIPAGSKVRILSMQGTRVVVEPVQSDMSAESEEH